MSTHRSRPREVTAHRHTIPRALPPPPFSDFRGAASMGEVVPIGFDQVGQLLVPNGSGYTTCPLGSWLVQTIEGGVSVLSNDTFNVTYEAIPEGEQAPPAPAAEETGVEKEAEG